ncbi:hypothetical protein D3C71_1663240 [compost metagenome]
MNKAFLQLKLIESGEMEFQIFLKIPPVLISTDNIQIATFNIDIDGNSSGKYGIKRSQQLHDLMLLKSLICMSLLWTTVGELFNRIKFCNHCALSVRRG